MTRDTAFFVFLPMYKEGELALALFIEHALVPST